MQKLEQHKLDSISVTAFTTLEGVVKQFIKDLQDYNEEDQTYVRSINIVKKLRDALEIPKCV
jgi:C4-type Zn-finger protein